MSRSASHRVGAKSTAVDGVCYKDLVVAMMENCIQEGVILRRAGFWKDDPYEMVEMDMEGVTNASMGSVVVTCLNGNRTFWASRCEREMLSLAAEVIPMDITRKELVDAMIRLEKGTNAGGKSVRRASEKSKSTYAGYGAVDAYVVSGSMRG